MQLDHAADVARVAIAEIRVHLVVDCVELAAELLDLLVGQLRQWALGLGLELAGRRAVGLCCGHLGSFARSDYRAISTGPSGALMQV